MRAADDAAVALLNVTPTTMAGLCALIEHAVSHDVDGRHWPEDLGSEDKTRSWEHCLLENISDALQTLRQDGRI